MRSTRRRRGPGEGRHPGLRAGVPGCIAGLGAAGQPRTCRETGWGGTPGEGRRAPRSSQGFSLRPHPSPTSCGPRGHLFWVFSQIHAVLCVGAGTPTSLGLSRSLPRSLQPWGGRCLRLRRPQLCAAPVPGALHTGQPWRGKGGGRMRRAFRGEGPDTRLVDDPNPGVPGKATVKLVQTKVRKWSESAPGRTPRGGGREKQVCSEELAPLPGPLCGMVPALPPHTSQLELNSPVPTSSLLTLREHLCKV